MASALERPVHMGKVYKYEARTFRQAERKVAEAERDALRTNPARETLTVKCIKCIAKNFERYPILERVPPRFAPLVTQLLPLDLDLTVAGPFVHDDSYWERRAKAQGWKNCQISEHGMTWKQLFFETTVQQELESYNPDTADPDSLKLKLQAAEDYVFTLELQQLPSHLDLNLIFSYLPNLTKLVLTYGVKNVGMRYERALFGMKISDATSLASCIRHTGMLSTLCLAQNLLDDDLLRMLMAGLISNQTITALDLSHNKITNQGARMLAKLLGPKSVIMSLNLCDNQIHTEGGRYLGRALRQNDSLVDLNLRLNRLADEGGAMLMEGLRSNGTLTTLNLGSNSLSSLACAGLCRLMRGEECVLEVMDLSGNELSEDDGTLLVEALSTNQRLVALDLRMNKIPMDSECMRSMRDIVRRNELRARDYHAH